MKILINCEGFAEFSDEAMLAYVKAIRKKLYCYVKIKSYLGKSKVKQDFAVLYDESNPKHRAQHELGNYVFTTNPILRSQPPLFGLLFFMRSGILRKGSAILSRHLLSQQVKPPRGVKAGVVKFVDNFDQTMAEIVLSLGDKAVRKGSIGVVEIDGVPKEGVRITRHGGYDRAESVLVWKKAGDGTGEYATVAPCAVYGKDESGQSENKGKAT